MINIDRSNAPFPESLKAQKEHRNDDVLDALYLLFRKKCYLTEQRLRFRNDMQIDHFVPQSKRPDLKFSWDNLYPIDHRANLIKLNSNPIGGYLDPCNLNDDVEKEIVYTVEYGGSALFHPRDDTNVKAVNTVVLLTKLHRELDEAIRNMHHKVVHAVARWHTAQRQADVQQLREAEITLRVLLSRNSPFTMLMRSIDVVSMLPAEFFD